MQWVCLDRVSNEGDMANLYMVWLIIVVDLMLSGGIKNRTDGVSGKQSCPLM
jgi:hypothetical protein